MVISLEEARELLGSTAVNMSDEQITGIVETLDVLAVQALEDICRKRIKEDATQLARLIYDIYQGQKERATLRLIGTPDNRDKKE